MAKLAVNGAKLTCSMGLASASLSILPLGSASTDSQLAATVQDMQPTVNIPPFGLCSSQQNPQVAAATAAAQGVLTPMPCLPVITGPWSPGSQSVTLDGIAALISNASCSCAWSGTIKITDPGSELEIE